MYDVIGYIIFSVTFLKVYIQVQWILKYIVIYNFAASAQDRVSLTKKKVKHGSLALLHCYNNGRVVWDRVNYCLPNSMQYRLGQILVIKQTKLSHGGTYSCAGWDHINHENFNVSIELIILGKLEG